jgi:hypothetical protein
VLRPVCHRPAGKYALTTAVGYSAPAAQGSFITLLVPGATNFGAKIGYILVLIGALREVP